MERSGRITGIQKFSIHDGPGIRTVLFLKGCPLRCPWCSNPETQETAGEIMHSAAGCIRCGLCAQACPENCISLKKERLLIRRKDCRGCGACAQACPTRAVTFRGEDRTAVELMEAIRRDGLFYRKSGGGVTFSGGEPLLQSEFVAALASQCKREGIHTAIETSGCGGWQDFERLLAHMDLFLYDIKLFDSKRHEEVTGVPNGRILDNLEKLSRGGKAVIVRIPIVPGFTEEEENLLRVGTFIRELGIVNVQILPYHNYGSGKYAQLGRSYALTQQPAMKKEALEGTKEKLEALGLQVRIGG